MALTGFAEEDGLNGAAGPQSFFDQAGAFDADEAGFGGQAAAKRHAELFQPAVVAARKEPRNPGGFGAAGGFSGCSHHSEGNKFSLEEANGIARDAGKALLPVICGVPNYGRPLRRDAGVW